MFGKRNTSAEISVPRPVTPETPAPRVTSPKPSVALQPEPERAPTAVDEAAATPAPESSQRLRQPKEYYNLKSIVFSTLIDTIDLTQLSNLDGATA